MASQLYTDSTSSGLLPPSEALTHDGGFAFCAALVTLTNGQVTVQLNTLTNGTYTLEKDSHVANFTVLSPEQVKYVKPIDPVATWPFVQENLENAAFYASSLIKSSKPEGCKENY